MLNRKNHSHYFTIVEENSFFALGCHYCPADKVILSKQALCPPEDKRYHLFRITVIENNPVASIPLVDFQMIW